MNIELMNLQAEYDSNEANIQILERTTVEDRAFIDEVSKENPYPHHDKELMSKVQLATQKEHWGLIELQMRYMYRDDLSKQIKEMEDGEE